MLDNTLSITYDSVAVTLTRIRESNYESEYRGEDSTMKFTLVVKHTVPPRGVAGESHMVRLDVEHYDSEGSYLRTSSAWTVIKVFDNVQDSTAALDCFNALDGLVDSTLAAKVINRES